MYQEDYQDGIIIILTLIKMENNKNKNSLENLSQTQELTTRISDLTLSVAVAFDRTNTLPRNIEQMVKDVSSEFKNVDIEHVQKAIRRGSLGFYGKTFGEVSTQEICIWIIKYIEENPRAEPMEQRLKRLNKGV